MRLSLLALSSWVVFGCGARVLWSADNDLGGGGNVAEPMGIWDEIPCPGYFDGLTCPAGCPLRVDEHAAEAPPGKVYCASACPSEDSCPLGTLCHEGKYCVFGPCESDANDCRLYTACWSDQPFCAPERYGGLVACAPFYVPDQSEFTCPYDGCYAQLDLPDGTTFCTIDCAFADVNNPCVVGAECPLQSPLPDGRTLCLPICESDADCFGGLTCRDAICQWPAAMP